MAAPTQAQLATARDFLARASRRIDGAAKAARRPGADPGEFDNNFDELRELVPVQAFAAPTNVDPRKTHAETHGLRPERRVDIDEAAHRGHLG